MSKLGIYDGDIVAANNSDIDGTDSTGATGKVKDGDNYSRSIVAWLKRWANDLGGVNTVGGTANAMTVTLASTLTAITSGLRFQANVTLVNTSATVTLVVTPAVGSAFASKNIKKYDNGGILVPLIPGDNAPGLRQYTYLSGPDCYVLLNPAQEARYPPGTLYGLTLSNNSGTPLTKIDIALGACRDGADSANMDLPAALTAKDAGATWAVGSSAGCLDTGALANNTWYHGWLIKRPDTGVVDFLISTSATAPTMPTNYTIKRGIGSPFKTNGSAQFLAFQQDGDEFQWKVPVQDIASTAPGTSAVTRTLTVPTGKRVKANVGVLAVGASGADSPGAVWLSDLSITDTAPASVAVQSVYGFGTSAGAYGVGATDSVFTNTSAQVRSRSQVSTASLTIYITTKGWIDTRGRL